MIVIESASDPNCAPWNVPRRLTRESRPSEILRGRFNRSVPWRTQRFKPQNATPNLRTLLFRIGLEKIERGLHTRIKFGAS